MKKTVVLMIAVIMLFSSFVVADVTYVSETSMQFEGAVGKVMNFFGGKPTKTVDYYKDDVHRSDSFDKKGKLESSQIIDLQNELFITLLHDKKQYTQMTFDEWKELMQSSLESMGDAGEADAETETETEEPSAEVEWDLKVDVEETGKKETIAGKKTSEVVLTLDLDAKVTAEDEDTGETESAKGGMIVTSSNWLYKGGDDAKKEMDAFNKRFAEKIGFLPDDVNFKEMMASALQEGSQLGDAIKTLQEESEKLDGMAMRVETVYETKVDPETLKKIEEEKAKEEKQERMEIPTSVGGLLGGLGKKALKNKMEKDTGPKERNRLMTMVTEVLEFETTSLEKSLFQVPTDYSLVERSEEE
jgi:hypothetical protein